MMEEFDKVNHEVTMHRRNTNAIEEQIKVMDKMIRDQEIRINSLNDYMATMSQRMTVLETRLNMERINKMGSGPSVVN